MKPSFAGLAAPLLAVLASAPLLAAEAAGGHGEIHPVIPPTAWGIAIFLSVLGILWWKAFPPITQALEKRAQLIRESLEAAERAKAEAEALMQKHEASLEKARVEARAIIEEGKADAERVKQGIVDSARRESEELAARARREIELAKRAAVDSLYRQAARLGLEVAEKVVKRSLSEKDHDGLIQESIRKYQETR